MNYYAHLGEKKLTAEEWAEVHRKDIENEMYEDGCYWHCNTYADYCSDYDECMEMHIANREVARAEYVWLKKNPFSAEWDERYSNFSDLFKSIYGRRPKYRGDLLLEKGLSADTPFAN